MSTVVIMMIDICLCDDIWRRIRWDWASGGHGTADLALRTENRKWEMESTESASDSRGVSPRPIGPSWIWLIFEMWEGSILGISDCRFNFSLPGNESISGWGRVEGEGGGPDSSALIAVIAWNRCGRDEAALTRMMALFIRSCRVDSFLSRFNTLRFPTNCFLDRTRCLLAFSSSLSLSLFNWFSCNQFCWSF